ncbi:hypothetical protein M3194_09385 [Paenibacillus glycanilyticus]|uniref:hypothetical protein n=1 Tax=Paenibacillus glycanilyticus TaxID=126569 RepID=UPI00203E6681|nr:hypothetical protein [Paenibacillus glycanilyticus]MCM3627578.1 hypothetical protein [Paenibacillus glycanilyticus]
MISEAITTRLLAQEMSEVVHLNRGSKPSPDGVRRIHADRGLLQAMLPKRVEWCAENFRNVTIFDNTAARKEVGYRYTIRWEDGSRAVIRELDQRGLIARSGELPFYDRLLERWEEHASSLVQEIRPYDQ